MLHIKKKNYKLELNIDSFIRRQHKTLTSSWPYTIDFHELVFFRRFIEKAKQWRLNFLLRTKRKIDIWQSPPNYVFETNSLSPAEGCECHVPIYPFCSYD